MIKAILATFYLAKLYENLNFLRMSIKSGYIAMHAYQISSTNTIPLAPRSTIQTCIWANIARYKYSMSNGILSIKLIYLNMYKYLPIMILTSRKYSKRQKRQLIKLSISGSHKVTPTEIWAHKSKETPYYFFLPLPPCFMYRMLSYFSFKGLHYGGTATIGYLKILT